MSTADAAEVDRLRTELDQLKGKLASEKAERNQRLRAGSSWVLTILAVLATVLALLSIWVFRTLNNTELFVERVGSIIESPEVAQEVGDRAAAQLVDALDLQTRIAAVLPEQAQVIAGPVTTAAQNYLADATTKLIGTEQFQQAWQAALTAGHDLTIAILSGTDTTAIENSDGVVVLNITPVINELLAQGTDFLSGLLNKQITAPTITQGDVDAGIAALESALGTDLPDDFGTITLFQSDDLAAAQQWYSTIKSAIWLMPLAALALIALALAVSLRRLRTLLTILVGVALTMLLVQLLLPTLQTTLVSAVSDQGMRGAVAASFDTVTESLRSGISFVLVLGVVAALVLFLTGGSQAAQQSRGVLGQTPGLAARHPGPFLAGGAVVGLILLAIIPGRTWGQFLSVLLLFAAYALAVLLAPRTAAAKTGAANAGPA